MKKWYFPLIVLLVITWTQTIAQTTYYVTTSGNDNNNGKSWATAKTLADAIATATSGDRIFVAKGTYTATSGSPLIHLKDVKSGLKLYGGFKGTETSLEQRTFGPTAADSTILQGNGNRVIYNQGTNNSSVSAVVYDGFTIKGGFAGGNGVGGGMCNIYASLTVTNCIFKENATNNGSGGGMYNTQNKITITNCKFYGNSSAANGGGALIASTGSSAIITRCTFDKNMATGTGGAISTFTNADNPTTVTITKCTFSRNTASAAGGAVLNYTNVKTTISDCTFSGNKALVGGGMYNHASSSPAISNCTFTDNSTTGGGGGAMYNFTSASPTVINCVFAGNQTGANYGGGGVVNNTSSAATYINCLFSGNKAKYGGGMFNAGGATPTLKNCTIAANNATTSGGGIYSTGASTIPVLTNCIVYGNSNGIYNVSGASATITYSNVQYTGGDETDYSKDKGNINANPLFANIPAYSTAPFTGGNYTLQGKSPAINTGNNSAVGNQTTDLAGNTRIYNKTVDMGAYERQN